MKPRLSLILVGLNAVLTCCVSFALSAHGQSATTPQTSLPSTAPRESVRLTDGAQDILKLARAKVDDEVTLAFIRNGTRTYDLSAEAVVYLQQQGVSDRVLAAMLGHQLAAAESPAAAEPSASTAPAAVAPQYVESPAVSSAAESVAPATVQVVADPTPYYSFYDPAPYYYSAWPSYWYGYSYWYPYYSIGWHWGSWYWGGCYYPYYGYCWYDNDHRDGSHHHSSHHDSWQRGDATDTETRDGNRQPATRGDNLVATTSARASGGGQRPPPSVNAAGAAGTAEAVRPGTSRTARGTVADRPTADSTVGNPTPTRSTTSRSPENSPVSRPGNTSELVANNNRAAAARLPVDSIQSSPELRAERGTVASRPVASGASVQPVAPASPTGPGARSTTIWTGKGTTAGGAAVRPSPIQSSVTTITRSSSAGSTRYWSGGPTGDSSVRPTVRSSSITVVPSTRINPSSSTVVNRSVSSSAYRSATRPSVSYQSSGASRSVAPRMSSGGASYSRPSSAPASRVGGGAAGASRPSGGGGFGRSR